MRLTTLGFWWGFCLSPHAASRLVRANHLRILATPVYTPAACLGGYYSSMIVVRENSRFECLDDLRGSTCAINTPTSHSGMNVLRALFAPMSRNGGFFKSACITGSHEASLLMIAHGWADVAAIDCITYALLQRRRSRALRGIRVFCCSSRFPAPPYVVGSQVSDAEVDHIRQALVETLATPDMRHLKEALLIKDVVDLPPHSYQSIADLERRALQSEYSEVWDLAGFRRGRAAHIYQMSARKEYDVRKGRLLMKNLFEAATAEEIKERIGRLGPDTQRQWGKMTAAQAMAHCSTTMEWALGDSHEPRMFIGRIVAPLVRSRLLRDEKPMARNTPTAKSLVVKDERDLAKECTRLSALIDRFSEGGPQSCTKHPHTFFGRLTPEEWARLMYKHLDHHLRQFGV